jgi:hypothetical protein
VLVKEGELVALKNQPSVLHEDDLSVQSVQDIHTDPAQPGEEELVPC